MRSRVLVGLVLLALAPQARAACSELSADGFQAFVDDAMSAIDDDDLVRHGAVFRAMQEQLPCLDDRIPVGPWSEFLVGFAVVEYAMGRDWEAALDVAVRINPSVRRDYGPLEIRSYGSDVVLEPSDAPELPSDAQFFVDGVEVKREPAIGKLHVVQRLKDGVWTSYLLLGEDWPSDWTVPREVVEDPAETGPESLLRASVYGMGGLVSGGQALDGQSSLIENKVSSAGLLLGLGSFGDYGPGGPVGLFWDISGPLGLTRDLGNGLGVEAYVGPSVFAGPVAINVGAGVTSVGVKDVDDSRIVLIPQPRAGVRIVEGLSDSMDLDIGVGAGWIFSGWHTKLHAGVRGGGDVGWNAGLTASANGALLEEAAQGSNLKASATAIRVGLRGGVSFGQ